MSHPQNSSATYPLTRAFVEFRAKNPHVEAVLLRLALEARARGRRRIGINLLWSAMRWELRVRPAADNARCGLNDHLQPFYARALMIDYPELDGLFDLRRSEADLWAAQYVALVVPAQRSTDDEDRVR